MVTARSPFRTIALLVFGAIAAGCASGRSVVATAEEHQALISRTLADLVDRTDKVFGEPRVEDRQEIVRAKVGIKATVREGEGTDWSVPANFRLPLPALERRANIFLDITADTDTDDLDDIGTVTDDKSASLSATILSQLTATFDVGAALRVHGGPEFGPEVFLRYEKRWEPWMLFGEQRGYWRTDNGWGGATTLNLDYRLPAGASYVRFANKAEYYEELHDANLKTGVYYRRPFFLRSALSAETGVDYNPYEGDPGQDGVTDPESDNDQVYGRVRMVGKVWRPWIEWEITPGYYYRWHHDDPGAWGVDMRLSIIYEAFLRGGE